MSEKILLIGAGGHCHSVLDSLLDNNKYDEIGLIDLLENVGKSIFGVPVIGSDKNIKTYYDKGFREAFITLGTIADFSKKLWLFKQIETTGFKVPVIVSADATVSPLAKLEPGVFVGKKAVVNAGAHIAKGAIINTGAIVEHDCNVGAFSHIASGAVLSGNVNIGECSHIGSSTVVRQGIAVGDRVLVGVGSVVVKNIDNGKLVYGNPAKVVRDL